MTTDTPRDVRSYTTDPRTRRYVYYVALTDEQLRKHAAYTGPGDYAKYDRAMLLALLHNRYPCGYFIEVQGAGPDVSP